MTKTERAVKKIAMALPDVVSDVACRGTSLESTTFTVKKKAFVFMRAAGDDCELRLKLDGKWEKKVVPLNEPPADLEAWLRESYSAFAPKVGKGKSAQGRS